MSNKFLYFAYGSNLLTERIHINNPSAKRAGIAKLQDYELDFNTYSKRWRGAAATIVQRKGKHVWGALWEIDNADKENLDRQEGVAENMYFAKTVTVETPEGTIKECRVYEQSNNPSRVDKIENLSDDRKPSSVYLQTIINGAKESELPEEFQRFLKRIPDNGYAGEVDVKFESNIIK